MSRPHRIIRFLAPIGLGAAAFATAHGAETSVPMSALKKCAALDSIAERVGCYDQLAERPGAFQRPATSAPSTAASPSASPAVTATASAAPQATATSPAPAPAAAPKESFGLYSAEHPAAPPAKVTAITAKVLSIEMGSSGRPVVRLEGDQVWEMDTGDPVLKDGDTVKIERALLGSFIMTTPSGRIHRLHRLR
jgi:hypothetical protein